MRTGAARSYSDTAEAAWRWVLDQVQWDEGPWIPETVPSGPGPDGGPGIPDDRDGMHSGIGGLAHTLAEIRLSRPWTAEEDVLAQAICERVGRTLADKECCTFFDGLVSDQGVLAALGADREAEIVERLAALAMPDGWPQRLLGSPRFLPDARINDLTLGTAGVLLAAVWAHRHGVPAARGLAELASGILLDEAVPTPTGLNWPFVPQRFCTDSTAEMPNLSHGVAGVATALALAGAELSRPDLVEAAHAGAEHLVSLGDASADGFVVPRYLPRGDSDAEVVTFTWCHGPTGTSLLFCALDRAGVADVAGVPSKTWNRRCLHSVRTSGLPARLRPGFWDNDGRCCGTAGVGEVFLHAWQREGRQDDLDFALQLADTVVERSVREGSRAWWRFVEHRAAEPLLPPGVGWMQGAAGIAAFLFRVARVLHDESEAAVVDRMDTWWACGSDASAGF